MKKTVIITSLILIVLLGIYGMFTFLNSINNNQSILKRGNVIQQDFKEEIPFELENGWTIIPVTINAKKYRFIYDTGALNIVSIELAKELNLTKIASSEGKSSTGKSNSIDLATLPIVKIGDIEFENSTTAIVDIKSQFKCYQIDGLIGSNLMRNAVWQVNNRDSTITLTNNINKLEVENYKDIISFSTNEQANPYLNLTFGSTEIKSLFDTGHNAKILINRNFLKKIPQSTIIDKIEFRGNSSTGIFKENIDTTSITTHCKFKAFTINNEMSFKDRIVTFTKGDSKIGNAFFSNYDYIIDWNQKKMFLKNSKELKTQEYISYGFGKNYNKNIVTIGELLIGSEASSKLKSGDQILEFNENDWSNLSQNEWCAISENSEWPDELELKIKRGDDIKDITIAKKTFIQ